MTRSWLVTMGLVMALGVLIVARPLPAEDRTETVVEKVRKERKEKNELLARRLKVSAPYSKLELTPDQVGKIHTIQQETRAKIRQLKQAEHEAILAALTVEQRDKLQQMAEQRKAEARERAKKSREKRTGRAEQKQKKDKE